MRRFVAVLSLAFLMATTSGCVIIAKDQDCGHGHGKRRVIEVDGEWYVVDVNESSVRKLEDGEHVKVEIEGK